jgi:hypothetical protein
MGRSHHQFDWTMEVKVNGQQVEFNALTCIDKALNVFKLNHIDNETANHIHDKFTQIWLC